jgi:hypothetical protein
LLSYDRDRDHIRDRGTIALPAAELIIERHNLTAQFLSTFDAIDFQNPDLPDYRSVVLDRFHLGGNCVYQEFARQPPAAMNGFAAQAARRDVRVGVSH